MKKLALLVVVVLSSNEVLLSQKVKTQSLDHSGSYNTDIDTSLIYNLFITESGDYLLVKDSIKGLEEANTMGFQEYMKLWSARNAAEEGETFYYLNEKQKNELIPELLATEYFEKASFLEESKGYKLTSKSKNAVLKIRDIKLELEHIAFQCSTPKNHNGEHSGKNKEQMKKDYGCTTFKIVN